MRYRYIDIAKGIAILLVIMSHLGGIKGDNRIFFSAFTVELFFILSGYVYKEGMRYKDYLISRWKRVINPYFIYNFIFLLIFICMEWLNINEVPLALFGIGYSAYCFWNPNVMESELLYILYNGPTWFLPALFCSSIIFFGVVKFTKKSKVGVKIIIVLFLTLLSKLLSLFPIYLPWSMDKAFLGAAFMYIGYEIKQRKIFEWRFSWKKVMLVGLLVVVYYWLVRINPNINISTSYYGDARLYDIFLCLFIGVIGTYLCVEVSKIIERIHIGTILECMGKHTIPLLALHLIVNKFYNLFIGQYFSWRQGSVIRRNIDIVIICFIIIGCNQFVIYIKRSAGGKPTNLI